METGEREVLGLMLTTNAEAVAAVLRGTDHGAYSPLAALSAARTLGRVIDDTMRSLAAQARSSGATWQDIGEVLGTTRQAAYQRFGPYQAKEEAHVSTAIHDAAERAIALFQKYTSQDWTFRSDFDETMNEGLSEEMLLAGWAKVTSTMGDFTEMGDPDVRVVQGHSVVDVPLTFARAQMKGRVVYNANGQVAGLFILDPTVA